MRKMIFSFYIPRDAGGTQVLNPATGASVTSTNNSNGSGTWTPLNPVNPTIIATNTAPPVVINDRSIAIQKTVVAINPGTGLPDPTVVIQPGTVLQYTINYEVSDFFAFNQFSVSDLIGDGQDFVPGFTPTLTSSTRNGTLTTSGNFNAANYTPPSAVNPTGTQTLGFNVSNELAGRGPGGFGGLLLGGSVPNVGTGGPVGTLPPPVPTNGPTTGTIVFRTVVLNSFYVQTSPLGNKSIKQGDILDNNVTGTAQLLDTRTLTPTATNVSDVSAATTQIQRGSLVKSIYAINGNTTVPSNPHISPGDNITYRLQYVLPLGRAESLALTDYLPLPVFDATQVSTFDNVTNGTAPAPGHAQFGPASQYTTIFPGAGFVPTLSSAAATNTVSLTFPSELIATPAIDTNVDVLFTVTASNLPFADGLFLTNQANYTESSTNNGSATANAIIGLTLGEPALNVKKGVVATDAPPASVTFAPNPPAPAPFNAPGTAGARFAGTITDGSLATTPINSNLSGVQANDRVTFAIVVQNTGSSVNGAFNVVVGDTLPAGFHVPASGLNLRVVDGAGAVIGFTDLGGNPISGLFGNGLQLNDPSAAQGALTAGGSATGTNIAIITYDLEADVPGVNPSPVNAGQVLTNTGDVSKYTSAPGGPNFLAAPITDPATVTIQGASTAKVLLSTSIVDATNSNNQATIGELATYQLTVTVPQGITPNAKIVDTLPAGLAFVALDPSNPPVLSAGVSLTGSTAPVITNNGQTITFNLGNVTNTTTNSAVPETITLTYQTVVLNVAGNTIGTTLRNSAVLSFNGITNAPVRAGNVTVIQPNLTTTKTVSVNGVVGGTGDAGDPVQYTITYTNPAAGSTTAYNMTVNDPIPAGVVAPTITSVSGSAVSTDFQIVGATVQNTDPNGLTLLPGQSITIVVSGTVSNTLGASTTVTNTASETSTTLPGNPGQISPFNVNSTERAITTSKNASFITAAPAPVKSIVTTSEGSTAGSNVTIGEILRYKLLTLLPEGINTAVSLKDNLPAGFSYLNDGTTDVAFVANQTGISSSIGVIGTGPQQTGNQGNVNALNPTFVLPASQISGGTGGGGAFVDGDKPVFTLGDLNNADRDPDQEFVLIEFNAVVDNVAGNTSGTTLNNTFTYSQNGAALANSNVVPVTVAEPKIAAVTKTVSPAVAQAGDTVSYTVTYTNTGTATAFDVVTQDTLPALIALNLPSINVTSTGVVTGINSATSSGNTVRVNVVSMDPGSSITVTYTGVVQIGIAPGQVVPNSAKVTYTSLPGNNGTTPNPTGSTTPGIPGSFNGERTGTGVGTNTYTATGNANITAPPPSAFTKTVSATSIPQTLGSNLNVGEVVTYQLAFTMPDGTSPILGLVDPLPAGIMPVAARIISIGGNSTPGATSSGTPGAGISSSPLAVGNAPGGSIVGQNVMFNFSGLVNSADHVNDSGDVIVVQIDGLIQNVGANSNGAVRTNTATLNYGAGTLNSSNNVTITQPVLQISKTPSPTQGDAGSTVTYTAVVSHRAASTGPAFDVAITDPLSAGLQLVAGSVTTSIGSVTTGNTAGDTTIGISIPVLNLGQTATITYQAKLANADAPGSTVPNTVTTNFDSAPGGGRPGTVTANANVTINTNSIAGFVYVDANNDGVKQGGEAAIPGVAVTLTGTDNLGNPVNTTVNTLANGSYIFPNLRPGTYQLTEAQPAAFFSGKDTVGTLFGGVASAPPADLISGITIPANSNAAAANYNFGELTPASLSGFVYNDANNDGTKQAAEAGIPGVTVTLTGVNDIGVSVNTIATTLANGSYSFANLRPSNAAGYTITETQPAAFLDGKDTIGTPGGTTGNDVFSNVVLTSGTNGTNNNFGELSPSSLSGFVYNDLNNNGVKDVGEPGILGATVNLSGNNDLGAPVTATATTLADGSYSFAGLRPSGAGGYTIAETQPAGFLDGKDTIGTPGGTTGNDVFSAITLPSGTTGTNNNFGELLPSSLSGFVYNDANNNGIKDVGEAGIPGATVTLTGSNDLGAPVNTVATTLADGSYSFAGLRPSGVGGYTITETQPAGFLDGKDTIGTPGGTAGNDVFSSIVLASNTNGTNNNFGELAPSSLAGFVYVDANDDGIKQVGEPGIPGATVTLTGTNDLGAPVNTMATTLANGSYSFANLRPSSGPGYTITETQPAGFIDGIDTIGTPGGTTGNDVFSNIVLASGVAGANNNFGELSSTTSLSGFVYDDVNNNGVKDAGELGIPGATVTLTGNNDLGVPVNVIATTLADGSYSFAGIRPSGAGGYTITETQPAGYLDGKDTIGTPGGTAGNDVFSNIVVVSGTTGTNNNFGELLPSSLAGFVYVDANNDGIKQVGEPGIQGATVTLTGNNDLGAPVNTVATTLANGSYSFANLRPSSGAGYTITETQPAGFLDGIDTIGTPGGTTGNDVFSNIVLASGVAGANNNFGELSGTTSLSGFVYNDLNNNGVKQAGEPGIQGATVTLTGNNDLGVPVNVVATTLADGSYSFAGIRPSGAGGYTITETQPAGFLDGKDTIGTPGGTTGNDVFSNIVVVSGTTGTNNNFGELAPSSLAGFVYVDANNDGIKQLGEPGIQGVTVTLTGNNDFGAPVSTVATTLADGSYSFANLRPSGAGGYTITETQPAAFLDGIDTIGTPGGSTANDIFSQILLASGITGANNNFGERIAADLALTKAVNDPTPNVGEVITYTLGLTNNGPSAGTAIVVSEAIPAGVTFQSATPVTGTFDPIARTWSVPNLASGASTSLKVTALVVSPIAQTNNASITSAGEFDQNLNNNMASATETPQQADLAVSKTVSNATPNVGDQIAYTVSVRDNGPDAATNVSIADLLPAGVTFVAVGTSATQGSYNPVTGLWTVGTLANGAMATLTIQALVVSSAVQTNTAAVNHSDQFDPVLPNNTASVVETPQIADVAVTKTVNNANPNPGDTITFTVVVTNNGPDTATNVVVADAIPAGLTNVIETTSVGVYNPITGQWTFASLAKGATATFTMTGTVSTTGGVTNTATVHATQFDPNLSNNTATAGSQVQTADLVLQKIAPAAAFYDVIAPYTFIIHNNGPSTATGVMVNDPFPASLQFAGVQSVSQGSFDGTTGIWNVGTLANGQTATLVVNFLVRATGTINNVATASAVTIDPNLNNNVSAAPVVSGVNPAVVSKGNLLGSSFRNRPR